MILRPSSSRLEKRESRYAFIISTYKLYVECKNMILYFNLLIFSDSRLSVADLLVNWKRSSLTWMVVFLLRWGSLNA